MMEDVDIRKLISVENLEKSFMPSRARLEKPNRVALRGD